MLPVLQTHGILFVLAAVFCLVLTPVAAAGARAAGAIAEPGERHIHRGRVPLLGGLALVGSVLGALALGHLGGLGTGAVLASRGWEWEWLAAGALAATATGFIDDLYGLSVAAKLAGQALAAVLAVAGGYEFEVVTNPLSGGAIDLGLLGAVASVLWIVGITNAFNLIDGLDGLAAGVAWIACVAVFGVALVENRPDAAILSATLGGALLGFLVFNFPPASIFLGDTGSLALGYLMSILSIQCLSKGAVTVVMSVPLLALGLPILDTLLTLYRRAGASLVEADQGHLHHHLVALGMTQRRAVGVLYAACALLAVTAFVAVFVRGPLNALIVAAASVAAWAAVRAIGFPGGRRK